MGESPAMRRALHAQARVSRLLQGRSGVIGTAITKLGLQMKGPLAVSVMVQNPAAFSDLPSQVDGVPLQLTKSGPVTIQGEEMGDVRGIHPKLDAAGHALWVRVDTLNPGRVSWVGFEDGAFWVHQGGCVQQPLRFPPTWAGHPVRRRGGGIVSVAPPAWVWPKGSRCAHGVPTGSANAVCTSCGLTQSKLVTFSAVGAALVGIAALGNWVQDRRAAAW